MATQRQMAANRRNAQNSTGPKTEQGKARSRGNAVTHGLTGAGVVVAEEDADALAERREAWRAGYDPVTAEDEWLYEQVVLHSVRIDRCQRLEPVLRSSSARRAALCWDDDRRLAAEVLGDALSKHPALIARKLRGTKQGCDWLIDRWQRLGSILQSQGAWSDAHKALAFDLLGTPAKFRDGEPSNAPGELVEAEIAQLARLQAEALDDLDESERAATALGLEIAPDRALTLLRRYEAACVRRLLWAKKQLKARQGQQAEPLEPRQSASRPPSSGMPDPFARMPHLAPPIDVVPWPDLDAMTPEERASFRPSPGDVFSRPLVPSHAPRADEPAPSSSSLPIAPKGNRRARRAAMRRQRAMDR
jgi:hypothetical protein